MTAPVLNEVLDDDSAAISRLKDTGDVTALPGVVCADDSWPPWPRDVSEQASRRSGRKLGRLRGARWSGGTGVGSTTAGVSMIATLLFSEEDVAEEEDQDDRLDEYQLSGYCFLAVEVVRFFDERWSSLLPSLLESLQFCTS